MKFVFKRILVILIFLVPAGFAEAQNIFFADVPEASFSNPSQKRQIIPSSYRTLQLNKSVLSAFLSSVPSDKNIFNRNTSPVIDIPMPDGGSAKFRIWESAVMEPGLAAKFPDIRTFTGQGIDDPTANIKLDFTPFGFHAMVISALNGAIFIDPYARGNTTHYISYYKKDYKKAAGYFELPPIQYSNGANRPLSVDNTLAGVCVGTQLRTYRLALAATAEYTAAVGGTVVAAQAAQATTMNRVNGVYERELAIRMVLVANNNLLIYTDDVTDPYTNNSGITMLTENQNNINAIIGNNNYDIGHVFSTGGGGIAGLGVVCATNQKAKGVTGSPAPANDPFDIDYVAHEMGHQFGANHPFNSNQSNCGGNGTLAANAEPGSGSTIMAYAGICGTDNLQNNSDANFHAISFNEISTFSNTGNGNVCAVRTSTGNILPVVNAGLDYVIPKSTPFILTGSGTDGNGDVLTYSWEQINVGGAFGTWDNPSGEAPLFRSYVPISTPVRFFPKLSDVTGNTTSIGELLPTYSRILKFRLTARDNRAGGGGICFDESNITVNENAGPFLVTYPNAGGVSWLVNDFKTVTWNPNGTAAAPVSCANVKIELSTNGGNTFPVTLVASTPNDGSEEIQVPNNVSSLARIRISAVGNVFYDLSNTNFAIQTSPAPDFTFNNPAQVMVCSANSGATTLKTASLGGFSTTINLTASGNPVGTTVTFGANSLSPGSNTTVTLNNTGSLAPGTYNITINGVAGAVNKSRIISFVVSTVSVAPSSLTAPAYNATGVSPLPSFNWSPVAGVSFYTLEISTSNTFTPIIQTISNITTLPYVLATPLSQNTVYYWRVSSTTACGQSLFSPTGIFKTYLSPCKISADVPKTISGTGTPTVTSTLVIPALSGVTISDLDVVGLTGTHSFISDITVSLKSPAGTIVVLWDMVCADEQDFDINLDDEALIAIPCPPTANQTAQPENPLSAFDGQNSAGTWTLEITDNADQDGGSLTGWGLAINGCPITATPISSAPWTQLCPPAASTSLTSNLVGISYQWQVNTGGGFTNITNNANYSGTNTQILQINNAPSSWSGYQYRCVVGGNNSTVFTLGFTSYWNGSVSSAWENPLNWTCNVIPDIFTDVIINSGNVIVNSMGICRSLTANTGATVTVNPGFKITVAH